ncbi:DUF6048 family protein [Xanthovirga aplysinae]|uniref:DUF6048 family protein n=1 Tax=Xanthovirga aplysinae TaxID=2529853 RepID=UPI0012BCE3D9|nr:DUF6048 family protein [Xanthovirga aplysinae]MTI30417.1 hypothetical protein [Xanthovirga aplysinae]
MKPSLKYIITGISLLLLLIGPNIVVWAQETQKAQEPGAGEEEKEEVKIPKRIESIFIGADLFGSTLSAFNKENQTFEFQSGLKYGPYIFVLESGYGKFEDALKADEVPLNELVNDFSYSSSGMFYRLGIDYDVMKNDPDYSIFFGFRYARTNFNESLSVQQDDPYFGEYIYDQDFTNLNGRWVEFTGGMKIRLAKVITMGYTVRYKFLPKADNPEFDTYNLPGFGRLNGKAKASFNYYLYYTIPFKKKKR